MSRLSRLISGVANIAAKDLGAYDRILMANLRGYGPDSSGEAVIGDAYNKVDLVFSCISYTAKAIAQIPLLVVKKGKGGKFDPVDESDEWQTLVDHPNYMTSKVQFVTSIISYLLLDGCVAIIPFPTNFTSSPNSLWVVPWKYCEYELDKNGHLKQWIYKPRGQEGPKYELAPNELFQVKFWNPENPLEGMAPIKAGRLPVMELYKSSDYNQRFFDQGAIPGGLLTTPQRLKQPDVDLVKTQFMEKHQGYTKRWEPAVLHADLKWSATGLSQRDMDFVNLRTKSSEAIMQIFGMKKVILGITESLNYATGREQRKEWWNGTCLPLMRLMSDALTYGLFYQSSTSYPRKLKNYRVQFDISAIEALHEDYASKVKTAEAMFRMGIPFEEINAMLELGLDPKPWYSLAFVPTNMMCVNYKDVGREDPAGSDQSGDDTGLGDVPTDDPNPTISDSRTTPKGMDQLIEHFNKTQEAHISRFVDENLYPHIRDHVKTMVNKIRRGIFDMRARTLANIFVVPKITVEEAKKRIESLSFVDEVETMKKGVVNTWTEIVDIIGWLVNNDQKNFNTYKEKVDTPDSRAIKTTWIQDFFTDIQNVAKHRKSSVLEILGKAESLDDGITQIKGMFNRSLNEAGPLIKTEVKRLVSLTLQNPAE